ncbi:tRNA (N6-threonylcarbamoyladenosine(37)-N6)-methyltransferase TrmO [Methanorbis rubei]|uniref:tRNA (Adenine(37)-N6)-methyltransferase n=1 Tax=Methanorbis rubei TaxID=3028300 RepID=A0AAE4SC48_9EURY|nr:tRNA (adenine(37)-N6)-methyltransferase [Methanocorpusculaceae archaeon Cs1]
MDSVTYQPIGIIHSSHTNLQGMPIQPPAAKACTGILELRPDLEEGLLGIEGFSRIILIYSLHKSEGFALTATPFLDTESHGVFATRVPRRPNQIGFSVVRLIERKGRNLAIGDVDILDGTPVLDIKPYVPLFDAYPNERCGWFEGKLGEIESARSDDRFMRPLSETKL